MGAEFYQDILPFEEDAKWTSYQHFYLTDVKGKMHDVLIESAMQAMGYGREREYAKQYARDIMSAYRPAFYGLGIPSPVFVPEVDIHGACSILSKNASAIATLVNQRHLPPCDTEGKWNTTALICYALNPIAGLEMFAELEAEA